MSNTNTESEYLRLIRENLLNIGEDMASEILNAYYRQCKNDDNGCIDNEGRNIYNLMDSKQAIDAVRHYGFANVSEAFSKKQDWILIVGVDFESKPHKFTFTTEAPSVVLDKHLSSIVCYYCYDPTAYPAFFREAVAVPLFNLCANAL